MNFVGTLFDHLIRMIGVTFGDYYMKDRQGFIIITRLLYLDFNSSACKCRIDGSFAIMPTSSLACIII